MRLSTRIMGPRMGPILIFTTILTLVVAFAPAAHAGSGYRSRLLRMVNATRSSYDLHRVRMDRSLTRDARRHTRRMIGENAIYDPRNLTTILQDEPWDEVGASVVGCADSLRGLHRAFMHHAAHRVILLNPQLRRIGIGVVKVDSSNACGRHWFWTTELFYG
jgi:uncharacterized protein YkwD